VAIVVGPVVVWGAACAWLLADAAGSLDQGADQLRAVRSQATVRQLLAPETGEDLDAAGRSFADADATLANPILSPLRLLPVAGRHLRAADRLASAGTAGVDIAVGVVDDLDELADQPQDGGAQRLAALDQLVVTAERAGSDLAALEVGSPDALIGPLSTAVAQVDEQRADAERGAGSLAAASRALATVLDGPEPYLLLGANNAEMRAGTGMFLSAAELRFDGGELELGEVEATSELVLPEGAVAVDGDLAANWPWLDVGRDLRNLGLSADFPQSAEVAVANWAQVAPGRPVAGVIAIDVDGLRGLLRAVGPVEVDGVTYTADTVRGELLRAQYRRFGDDRDARRDQLGAVAGAVFAKVEAGDWAFEDLAVELADAVAGRHLIIWSADETVQQAWRDVGADGRLRADSLSVALVNRSATKLDSWIESDLVVVVDPAGAGAGSGAGAGAERTIEVTATFTNDAPEDGPPYLVGPNVDGLAAGDHRGLVVVNLPAGARDVTMDGARLFLEGGDGPTTVVAGELDVARGEQATVTVTATLPSSVAQLTLEPTARVPRSRWQVLGETYDRDRRRTVDLAAG
jgi:hypothetical protein